MALAACGVSADGSLHAEDGPAVAPEGSAATAASVDDGTPSTNPNLRSHPGIGSVTPHSGGLDGGDSIPLAGVETAEECTSRETELDDQGNRHRNAGRNSQIPQYLAKDGGVKLWQMRADKEGYAHYEQDDKQQ